MNDWIRKDFFRFASFVFILAGILAFSGPGSGSRKGLKDWRASSPYGSAFPEGQKQVQGYDLWAETANKAGGVKVAASATRSRSSTTTISRTPRERSSWLRN